MKYVGKYLLLLLLLLVVVVVVVVVVVLLLLLIINGYQHLIGRRLVEIGIDSSRRILSRKP